MKKSTKKEPPKLAPAVARKPPPRGHVPDDDEAVRPPVSSSRRHGKHDDERKPAASDGPRVLPDTTRASSGRTRATAFANLSPDEQELQQAKAQARGGGEGVAKAPPELATGRQYRQERESKKTKQGLAIASGRGGPSNRDSTDEAAAAPPPLSSPVANDAPMPPVFQATQSAPGAVAVPGIHAQEGVDQIDNLLESEEITTPATTTSVEQPTVAGGGGEGEGRGIPEAKVVTDDEDPEQELIDELVHAEPASPDELEEEARAKGLLGWVRTHRALSGILVVVVIGAIVGGVVGASKATSGPADSEPSAAPSAMPSSSPTMAPTWSTLTPEIIEVLSQLTDYSVFTNPSTPQYAAVDWLLNQDGNATLVDDVPRFLQRYALATIYYATLGEAWTNQLQFLTAQDDCLWNDSLSGKGATCNEQGFVNSLALASNNLGGTFPEEIAGLPFLTSLAVSSNAVGGSLPRAISQLTDLTIISFEYNSMSGDIPTDLGALSRMTTLDLSTNQLIGPLPSSIGQMTPLVALDLNTNRLSGMVPTELSNLTNLKNIFLERNDFTGSLEALCPIEPTNFQSDCLSQEVPFTAAEVECSCCTICCADNEGCLLNNNL